AVACDDRLAPQHVAPLAALRRVIVDGQRAHHGRRFLLAVPDVCLLADEVLLLDLAPSHPGLRDVVLAVELEPERAVALLEPPGGAVDPDARGRDAARQARLPD